MDEEKRGEIPRVLNAASEQIGIALRDSQAAVEALGASLGRLAELLSAEPGNGARVEQVQALRSEMGQAVMGLQFYDRMTQHLTHVQDYLAAGARELKSPVGANPDAWEGLGRKLADRLLSDTHRMYLGRNLEADFLAREAGSGKDRGKAPSGDVDLF